MLVHLGGDVMLFTDTIVAIVSADAASAHFTHDFLPRIRAEGRLVRCAGNCSSYVVAMIDGRETVYESPISSATLLKRSNFEGVLRR